MLCFRTLRGVLDIGQDEWAKAAGLSTREFIRIENGEVYPPRETLSKIDVGFRRIMRERLTEIDEELKEEQDG